MEAGWGLLEEGGSGGLLEERSGVASGCVAGTCVALMLCIPAEAACSSRMMSSFSFLTADRQRRMHG